MLMLRMLKLLTIVAVMSDVLTYVTGRPRYDLEVSSKVQLNHDLLQSAVELELTSANDNNTGEIKDNMLPFLYRPVTAKNNTDPQPVSSIFNACLQACSQHTHSISELHGCHRECLSDPFTYTVLPEVNDPEILPGVLPLENDTMATGPGEGEYGQAVPGEEGGQNPLEGHEDLDAPSGEYGSQIIWDNGPEEKQEGCCSLDPTLEEWGPPS